MNAKKFFGVALLIAVLAALVQVVDLLLQTKLVGACPTMFIAAAGFSWLAFQAWASYFIAGCSVKGGVQVFVAYVAGIIGSILIMVLGGWFGGHGFGFWAVPASLVILVIPVIYLELAKVLIPILFVGAGAFFAIMTYVPGATYLNAAITEVVYLLLGLIAGWVTVTLRVKYEAWVTKK